MDSNFSPETELHQWTPEDWRPNPDIDVKTENAKIFCNSLNGLWQLLGRKMSTTIRDSQERFSLLYLPNPFIVPGGRFRETYYWDSFWIIRGLLVCGMAETARGMIDNLCSMVTRLGYVPNGSRLYYTRSQPPLLAMMVDTYLASTGDTEWAVTKAEVLAMEWDYWVAGHSVTVSGRRMFRYRSQEDTPRPESYREDVKLADKLPEHERSRLWRELRSAAESGWDFSSRWFKSGDGSGVLEDTEVSAVIPVDLNAFMAKSAGIIHHLLQLDNSPEASVWKEREQDLVQSMEALMWDEEQGAWCDVSVTTGLRRRVFSASNLVPLWTKSMPLHLVEMRAKRCLEYLRNHLQQSDITGVPTTLVRSGEQWDLPNIWPPLEHMVIMGLYNSDNPEAMEQARSMAKTRVSICQELFTKTGHMYEKVV